MTATLHGDARHGHSGQMLTVGEVATEFGVTVRTLHHYDELGVLRPSERSRAGYRLYSDADLQRLQQIVVYRRLGFSLEQVATLLDDASDVRGHLQRQRDAVINRIGELRTLAAALDAALEAEMNGYQITKDEQRELFGDAFSDDYVAQARERWGDQDAWTQASQRTQRYTKEQWTEVKREMDAINDAFAALLTRGCSANDDEAVGVAERARRHINTWFYDCSPQMHATIASMYVEDPRFMATYEAHTPGLAQFVHDAVQENAARSSSRR